MSLYYKRAIPFYDFFSNFFYFLFPLEKGIDICGGKTRQLE